MAKVEIDPCEVCGMESETLPTGGADIYHVRCPQCGDVVFTGSAAVMLSRAKRNAEAKRRIQGYIRDQNRLGAVPTISTNTLEKIIDRPLPSITERADRLLLEALHRKNRLGVKFDFTEAKYVAATYSLDSTEVMFLVNFLEERDFIRGLNNNINAEILPNGYIHADELLHGTNESSDIGFVAMWFDPLMKCLETKGMQPGILNAGYTPLRVDQVEHIGRIDDEIIANINKSRFVVADFTGHRGGVYFEAGYAMGRDLPVIWTCWKEDVEYLHFDIRQYNCIDWEGADDLAKRLAIRIEAALGRGPH